MHPETPTIDAQPTLLAASHWRIGFPFAPRLACLTKSADLFGRCVGAQARHVGTTTGIFPADYIVSSTVLSGLCPQSVCIDTMMGGIEEGCGTRPLAMLRAYECSGWGFALRFLAEHTEARHVMITIVDVDLHRSSLLGGEEHWGRSGFGLTTLLLELPVCRTTRLTIGRSDRRAGTWGSDTRAFANLVHAVRQRRDAGKQAQIFVHFMAKHIRGALEKTVGTDCISPNRFNEYGHCFGADPWIGMIEWAQACPADAPVSVTAASLSNNGYYTLCDLTLTPQTYTELRVLNGDEAELRTLVDTVKADARLPHGFARPATGMELL